MSNWKGMGGVRRDLKLERKTESELAKESLMGLFVESGFARANAQYYAGVCDALQEVLNAFSFNAETGKWEISMSQRKYFFKLKYDYAAEMENEAESYDMEIGHAIYRKNS